MNTSPMPVEGTGSVNVDVDRNQVMAETVAGVAAWLTVRALPTLPPIAAVSIGSTADGMQVSAQLPTRVGESVMADLAAWAEHLDTDVDLECGRCSTYLRAFITARLEGGQPVELWNHLDVWEWRALEDVTGHDFNKGPASFGADVLRRAAAWRAA